MYKLLAIDMDDTLLNDNLEISEQNKKKIKEAVDQHVKVVFCSGRSTTSILSYLQMLDAYGCNEYLISFNGAMVKDLCNNHTLFYEPVSPIWIYPLIDFAREHQINIQLYNESTLYVDRVNERTERYKRLSGTPVTVVEDLKEIAKAGSIKVLFNHEHEALKEIKPILDERLGDKINIFFSKPNYLEFLSKNASKGVAVSELAKILKIKKEEVIVVGDSFNDLSMIQYAGMGCAMANAHTEVKKEADYVTTLDNNHSGVAEVIDRFILK